METKTKLQSFVDSHVFQTFIIAVIIFNAIIIGIETCALPIAVAKALRFIDLICIVIYTVEAILKIAAYRGRYFTDPWNIFDFVILLLCLIPASVLPIPVQVARILRTLRAVRVLRLVSNLKYLRILVDGIARAIPGVMWTAVLLIIVYYVFAIIGTVMFGPVFPDWFGNLGDSFYTLFQVMTLESWSMGISRPVMEAFPWAWIYFVPFVIISAFIMANAVVGIIVGTMDEARAAMKCEEAAQECLAEEDADANDSTNIQATVNDSANLEEELAKLKAQLSVVESLLEKQQTR